jgi:hypothetical protein
MAIKKGERSQTQVLLTIDLLTERCKILARQSNWPDADPRQIEEIVVRARMEML